MIMKNDKPVITKTTLCRDDLIEWVLSHLPEEQVLELHESKHLVAIYASKVKKEVED